MIRKIVAATFVVLLCSVAILGYLYFRQYEDQQARQSEILVIKEKLERTEKSLFGYTRYIDLVSETKKSLEGQTKFLAATVSRDYTVVEHVQKPMVVFDSDAAVMVKYTVEYSVGFDLKPENFTIAGNKNKIVVTVTRPALVANPSVNIRSQEILSKGAFTDEKNAIIVLQQRLLSIAQHNAIDIVKEAEVIALCEKKLGEFLLDFMGKQPGVRFVPAVEFVYR